MNIGGILGGAVAAAIGAAAWAGLAYYANFEVGYLAWGIGLLVGLGVSFGSRGGGVGAAVVAVVFTVLSLMTGKYAAVQMAVHDLDAQLPAFEMVDDDYQMTIANQLVSEKIDQGLTVEFRNGMDYDTTETLDDFPVDVAKQARSEFDAMTEAEKQTLFSENKENYDMAIAMFENEIVKQGFWESFGPIDIVFFLLGIVTAGKVALNDVIDD